jgi:zinc/manganese transport system permease protein
MFESLDWSIIGPAFVAGLIVLSTHVPLGQEVLKRGIIFIDLAIAQVAGLGVIAAYAMEWDPQGIEVQLAAVSAALIAAVGLYWTERRWSRIQEPLIGTLFILAATGGILLLAGNPHGSEHLKDLLVGQVVHRIWPTWPARVPVALRYAVEIVGIYLVFASLIIPALATAGIRRGNRLVAGYLVGGAAYLVGIILSFWMDLPTGAVIVWSMAVVGLLAGLLISDKRRSL